MEEQTINMCRTKLSASTLRKCFCLILAITCLKEITAKSCSNIPPFLSRLRDGVDITKLDLLPLDLTGNDGFRSPLIDFTCDLGITKLINGVSYEIPDQIWSIVNIPSGWLNSNIRIYKTSHSVKTSMSLNADLNVLKGMFSASGSYKKMQDYITNSSKYIEDISSYTSGYKVNLKPFWAIRPGDIAKLFIDNFLPITLDNNTMDEYMMFINIFGTHFFNQGKFGGLLRVLLATDQTYFKRKSDSTVEAQASATFFKIINLKGGGSSSSQTVDVYFTKRTTKTVRYYGGSTNLLKEGGIAAWQPTVAANPWLFSGSLTEISNLIKNTSQRQAMKRAVQIYIDKAYLRELLRMVQWQYTAGKWDRHRNILNAYRTQLENLLIESMPSHTTILSLGKTIEGAASIPDWFKKTQFCYNWYPEDDGGQCGGGARQQLCAEVNSMTGYYRDDTDERRGGCWMRWGMFSSGYEDWFKNVQICYHWRAEADVGQCGGGVSNLLCAAVNSYTMVYKDDTDNGRGGCFMRWMLYVPSEAPLWLQNAELCFEWYADDDGGQCGGGVPRLLCARPNSFTRAYRDDTDQRAGGCRMRWFIRVK